MKRDELDDMMKKQFAPNLILGKMKVKRERQEKARSISQARKKFLNVEIEMKGEEELSNYQMY